MMKILVTHRFLVVLVVLAGLAHAGTTGKISGHVRDAENGEPLPGANITIQGTHMGAAADLAGDYSILNIPPGMYTLKISMIGYRDYILENVRVKIDLTVKADAELQATVLEAEETVTVVAERPMVQLDMTSSLTSVAAEEIELLPTQSVTGLLSLQAGVINYGGIHIRGGRSGEVAY